MLHLGRRRRPAEWNELRDGAHELGVVERAVGYAGGEESGTDGVDAYSQRSVFETELSGQVDHRAFRGVVDGDGHDARRAHVTPRRGDIDHFAALLRHHDLEDLARAVE